MPKCYNILMHVIHMEDIFSFLFIDFALKEAIYCLNVDFYVSNFGNVLNVRHMKLL